MIPLGRRLGARERAALRTTLRALLHWQRTLGRTFPRPRFAPDATPYVSLYANGVLRGCYGSPEGAPPERLARAFLLALADARYGGVSARERGALEADVAYIRHAAPVRADEAADAFEPGVQGVAHGEGAKTTVLLPSVAREKGHDARATLELLWRKAKAPASGEGLVWVLDVEEVSSRGVYDEDALGAARRFLESLVGRGGEVAFLVDPASGERHVEGPMRLGRAAVALEALARLRSPKARTARDWLTRAMGKPSEARPDMWLGTLALAQRATIETPLATVAAQIDPASCSPWHAAQAAAALGKDTPDALWQLCVRSLETRPLAPYVLMAARLRGDREVATRCAGALIDAIRTEAPFRGGADFTEIPETALTAVSVEALHGLPAGRAAERRARAFLLARQVRDVPAAMHPAVLGAFRASSIAPVLRCDITGHAVLALAR